ncbi:AraC family transcriptional regulator [Kiritimatiellota bacterium B12222]|nr:AraC family transcriptional regulator [Kiritimatiellota bacterium B12222]
MPKTISKVLHNKLLRSSSFKGILSDFHQMSGMEVLYLDVWGNSCLQAPRKSYLKLHAISQKFPVVSREWTRLRHQMLAGQSEISFPFVEVAVPLHISKETIGYLLLSACRDPEIPEDASRLFWTELAKNGVHLSWVEWKSAIEELPVCGEKARKAWQRSLRMHAKSAMREVERLHNPLPQTERLPPMILQACDVIQTLHHEPLRLQQVAKICGVSAEHLSRVFHQSTGLRFREYLAEIRIRNACERLQHSRDPISLISEKVGFSTLSRFNHTFKTHTDMTPSAYRKNPPPSHLDMKRTS